MFSKKTKSGEIDETVARSVNFELTIADLAKRSERRAWWVAFGAIVMALILAGGYFYMLPLKEKVPFLVMADAYSGTATVARLNEDFTHQSITASEAINRSNIAHFVLAREAYDLALINLRDWTTVLTMSGPGVAAAYRELHASQNPNSPYKTYGRDKAIRVKILSIVLIGGGPNVTPKGATVRFQRSLYEKQTGVTRPMDSKIATMEFNYNANLKMDEQYRIENPLGFQVTSYRVDNDYASAAPEEVPVSTPDPVQPPPNSPSAADAPVDPSQTGLVVPPPPMPERVPAEAFAPAAAAHSSTPANTPQGPTQGARR